MRTGPAALAVLGASLVAPALTPARLAAQQAAWDPQRHVLVVTSPLDSADAYPVVVRAFEAEGLEVVHPDSARGRIICAPRPSDSYGTRQATVQYLALVHRLAHGGSEIWLGAMLHTPPLGDADPGTFARMPGSISRQTNPMGDYIFVSPRGGSVEWQRLQRVADSVARAGR